MKDKEVKLVLVVVVGEQQGGVREDGRIVSKSASRLYHDNFDTTFGKKNETHTVN